MAERYLWPPFGRVHIARNKTTAACGIKPKSPWVGDTPPPRTSMCRRCLRTQPERTP